MHQTTTTGRPAKPPRGDAVATDQRVFAAVVSFMRKRDRVCFATRENIAWRANRCTKTVDRSLKRMENAGILVRQDSIASGRKVWTVIWTVAPGVRRLPRKPRPDPVWQAHHRRYVGSDEWAAFRDAFAERHPKSCFVCGKTTRLNLHHITYKRFGGQEHDDDLVWLCAGHHKATHNLASSGVPLRKAHFRVRSDYRAAARR